MDLPAIFLLENNRYSVATNLRETAGFEQLAIRAAGYDMPALIVDGMDPIAVLAAVGRAREHAAAHGPVLIEANTYRYYHQNGPLPGSAFRYRTRDEERAWAAWIRSRCSPRRLVRRRRAHPGGGRRGRGARGRARRPRTSAITIGDPGRHRASPWSCYPVHRGRRRAASLGQGAGDVDPALLDPAPAADGTQITYHAAVSGGHRPPAGDTIRWRSCSARRSATWAAASAA